jgi:Flp pilus assembly pilin Flp
MRDYFLKKWIQLRHCEDGVTLVEYGVGVALAVTVFGYFGSILAPEISGAFTAAGNAMP